MSKQRMKFIPELREGLMKNLEQQGLTRSMVVTALERWDAGEKAQTPFEHGCFSVFQKVQDDIEKAG